ncbi:MAG TPA: redoxin domain-containing protein [Ktedonobacteraceae bacterium]|nr:redoxin domain-containing protein [Ktedonobacteraceae bacterium]
MEFELPDLQGRLISSKRLFKLKNKQKLLLLFLSTTCDSCRILLNSIAELTSSAQDQAVPIVLICIGQLGDVMQMVSKYSTQLEGTHILVDQGGFVARRYGIRGVPFGMVLNKFGQVMQQSIGPTSDWLQNTLGGTDNERVEKTG